MKSILLHICCAPCSSSVVKMLCEDYNISFYWWNPNIYDIEEYKNRKKSAIKYAKELKIPFYDQKDFFYNYDQWKGLSYEQCNNCYALRLQKSAIFAKENNFDFFSTSLLSSPFQKHDLIKTIAMDFSNKYNIKFLYKDFRIHFYDGKNSLKQKGYYMQKYCGCNKSYKERFNK